MTLELRTTDLKKTINAFEQERDKLLDQVQYLKGNSDRLEWVIKVLNAQLTQIEQEETQKTKQAAQLAAQLAAQHAAQLAAAQQLATQQAAAMQAAHEQGNVGKHPDERKSDIKERKKQAQEAQEVHSSEETPKKKKGKKLAADK